MSSESLVNETTQKYLPWLGAMAIFMQALDATILNTALPSIAKNLHESPLNLQSVIVAYTLTVALLIPLSGWLADKFGTKRIFMTAVGIFALGSLCCSLSVTLDQLVMSRILQAVGGSMMVPVARLTLIYAYPKDQLLKVINFITIPALIGPMLGPTVGGFLVETLSWHWIFLVNIPFGLFAIWMASFAIPDFKNAVKRFDVWGWIYFSGGLTTLTLIIERWNSPVIKMWHLGLLLVAALTLIGLYIRHAKRVDNPLITLGIFKIRTLRVGLIGNLVTRFGIGGMPLMIPLMLQVGYGYTAFYAGLMMIPSALSNLTARSFVVPIVKKYGYKNTLICNTAILGILIGVFFFLEQNTPLYILIPMLMAHGSISAIQFTSLNTISLADLDKETSSEGNSLLSVTQQLSLSLGISIASMVLILFKNSDLIDHTENITVFRYTFLVMGILTVVSSLVFLNLKREDGNALSGRRVYKGKKLKKLP